jgi:hypothetical protein
MSLVQRFIGILFSPKATFASVVSYPRWLGIVLLTSLIAAGSQFALGSTEAGRQMLFDQQVAFMERFTTVNADAQAAIRQGLESTPRRALGFVAAPIVGIVITALVAGVLFGVFAVLGGTASYKQVMAVVGHGGVIGAVWELVSLPLYFVKGSMGSATNFGALWPGDEQSFIAAFLGCFDVFIIWQVFVLAIGLAVLYRRRTQPLFLSLLSVYVLIAAVIATVKTALGGS